MRLTTVYARFYKSFNFDHLRKATHKAKSKGDWETFRGGWYPYVEVDLDGRITTIVGANESGKSHLLSAIEKAVSGEGFEQRDLCRYSPFFSVERESTCWPHLGLGWTKLDHDEATKIAKIAGTTYDSFDHFMMFRETPETLDIWLPIEGEGWKKHEISASKAAPSLAAVLPKPFHIVPDVALPAAVPLGWLAGESTSFNGITDRRKRATLLDVVPDIWPTCSAIIVPWLKPIRSRRSLPRSSLASSSVRNASIAGAAATAPTERSCVEKLRIGHH